MLRKEYWKVLLGALVVVAISGSAAPAGNLLIAFDAGSQYLREYDGTGASLSMVTECPVTSSWPMCGVAYVGDIDSDATWEYVAGLAYDPIPAPRNYGIRGFSPLSNAAEAYTGWTASWPTTSLDYSDYDGDGTTELIVGTWIYSTSAPNNFDIRAFEINWGSPIMGGAEKVFPTTSSWPIVGVAGVGDPDSDGDWEYVAAFTTTAATVDGIPGNSTFYIRGFNSNSNASEKDFGWTLGFAIEDLTYGDYDDDGDKELIVAFEYAGSHYLRAYALDWAAGTLTQEKDFGWTPSWPINGLAVIPREQ